MSGALCPPLGHTFTVEGKISDSLYKQFKILVNRCNTTADPSCMNDTIFAGVEAALGQFVFVVPLINTNINSESSTYKEFYIADQNYFRFSSQLGIHGFADIQKDVI